MRGYAAIGLHRPKSRENIGGVLRAAYVFGASMVAVGGLRIPRRLLSRKMPTDTPRAGRHLPFLAGDVDVLTFAPVGAEIVAVELCKGAKPLASFVHSRQAFYVFGPEDGSLPDELLERCDRRVMVPTNGSMNLAATVNVVLYDRAAKADQ